MTPKQFRIVIVLLVGLIGGQWIQTALQLRSAARVERAADSAEVSGIDAVELSKDILRTQKGAALLPAVETPLEIAERRANR